MPKIEHLAVLTKADLNESDQEIVRELCEKYGIDVDVEEIVDEETVIDEKVPEAEVPEVPEESELPNPSEKELPEVPPEAPSDEIIEEVPEVPEVPPEAPVEQPIDEVLLAINSFKEEIASLKAEIESLKTTIEGVAVREPISEEEADEIDSTESVGQRVKGSPANVPEKSVASILQRRLGGLSR